MESITVGPRPDPASDVGSQFNLYVRVTTTLAVAIACALIAAPAAILGMAVSWIVSRVIRPTLLTTVVLTVGASASFIVLIRQVAWMWPFGLFVPGRLYDLMPPSSADALGSVVGRSCAIEQLLGPALFLAFDALLGYREHTLSAGLYHQAPRNAEGERGRWWQSFGSPLWSQRYDPNMAAGSAVDPSHPNGSIRLGVDRDNRRRAFDLTPDELRQHVFAPGASGSGKTTTLARIADGAMGHGYGLVIVDCKGVGLGSTAQMLARRHGLPYYTVDPDDPDSLGYNACAGDPADVTNKLIGAFSFGAEGEIYKQVAMSVVPVLVRGLMAADRPVTLASVTDVCDPAATAQLARQVAQAHTHVQTNGDGGLSDAARNALHDQLMRLSEAEGVGKAGATSLLYRFGALLQGKFGPLFTTTPALDWDALLSTPCVVYVSLAATAASEDVELMGRVIAQDLKQLCGRRLRAIQRGETIVPTIIAFDEFAALKEADQITDLLLQARQAEMPVLLSTQFLPESIPIRKAALSAGLLIAHRLESQDAEDVAAQFGTRNRWKVTYQTNWETGETEKGSIRTVDEFVIHPNVIRRLAVGQAAVRSVPTARHCIVQVMQVAPPTSDPTDPPPHQ